MIVKAGGRAVSATHEVTEMLRDRKSISLVVVRNKKEMPVEVSFEGG